MYRVIDQDGTISDYADLMAESARKVLESGGSISYDGANIDDPSFFEKQSAYEDIVLVSPPYVDDRMLAVLAVFDSMSPAIESEQGSNVRMASKERTQSFSEALSQLRKIVMEGVSISDEN